MTYLFDDMAKGCDDIFILWHGDQGGMTYLFDGMAKGWDDIFILWHGDQGGMTYFVFSAY